MVELEGTLNESAKPLAGSAAGLLSLFELRTSQAWPKLFPAVAEGLLLVNDIDAIPDLYAFTGWDFHGPLSRESIRLKASFDTFVEEVGVVGRPRRIGAMASSTFSRA